MILHTGRLAVLQFNKRLVSLALSDKDSENRRRWVSVGHAVPASQFDMAAWETSMVLASCA
ncbi:MAG: hypothetical protein P4L46_08230 [Fimbriimonas sp.]|nr:hypothetical protein [Fimbriimonas sp.]